MGLCVCAGLASVWFTQAGTRGGNGRTGGNYSKFQPTAAAQPHCRRPVSSPEHVAPIHFHHISRLHVSGTLLNIPTEFSVFFYIFTSLVHHKQQSSTKGKSQLEYEKSLYIFFNLQDSL